MGDFEKANVEQLRIIQRQVDSLYISEPHLNWLLVWVGINTPGSHWHEASAGEVIDWLHDTIYKSC